MRGRSPVQLVLLASATLLLGGCSSDSDDGSGAGGESGSAVDVTLQEFAVSTSKTSVPAGKVEFDVTNKGPEDTHEFVVIKTGLAPTELPTDETGAVDEEGEGLEPVDEIEDIEVGDSQTLRVDLEPGDYVLICNIYDKQEQESHYQEGMRTSFTVE